MNTARTNGDVEHFSAMLREAEQMIQAAREQGRRKHWAAAADEIKGARLKLAAAYDETYHLGAKR